MLKKDENCLNMDYEVNYRNVKYPRLEYKTGNLLLILPQNYENEATILEKHKKWIMQKEELIKQALKEAEKTNLQNRTNDELEQLVQKTVNSYQHNSELTVNQVFFRKMKTKWASFSTKGNLTVNTLLKHLPYELIEYVIFHEMTHCLERKHNQRFWNNINKKFDDYQKIEKQLLIYWFVIQTFQ
ncbi:MAG: M48 family metallopeptidase [Candidatus Bathyarchaeota archaeon]|nr:MAG: M48 family metallopeptidase [Candidatus Bathyarchaeota archaeon]